MAASITKEPFGKTSDGKDVYTFTLTAGKITVRILNYGCVIKDILVPDKEGKLVDINIGLDNLADYESNPAYMGSICGRVANRIGGAEFSLDGTTYEVSKNDPFGNSMCHGGFKGLTRKYYDWNIDGTKLVLSCVDEDGAEGFPGDVTIHVTYQLTESDGLMIDYSATTTKATPIDMSNHFMVNLGGHDSGFVGDHVLTVNSNQILEFGDKFIPTGAIQDISGTVTDLQKPTLLSTMYDKTPQGDGVHWASLLSGKKGEKKYVGRAEHPASGRYMEVYTTELAVVMYSCYYLDVLMKDMKGKGGVTYQKNGGILYMPQGYPGAVNHKDFPSCILRPGETYHTTSWYKFGASS